MLLVARIVLDWIRALNPNYRPNRVILVLGAVTYGATDWLIKPISRLIRPIRIGSGYLDFSILVIFLVIALIEGLLSAILL